MTNALPKLELLILGAVLDPRHIFIYVAYTQNYQPDHLVNTHMLPKFSYLSKQDNKREDIAVQDSMYTLNVADITVFKSKISDVVTLGAEICQRY